MSNADGCFRNENNQEDLSSGPPTSEAKVISASKVNSRSPGPTVR
jgi:hypothetical protein